MEYQEIRIRQKNLSDSEPITLDEHIASTPSAHVVLPVRVHGSYFPNCWYGRNNCMFGRTYVNDQFAAALVAALSFEYGLANREDFVRAMPHGDFYASYDLIVKRKVDGLGKAAPTHRMYLSAYPPNWVDQETGRVTPALYFQDPIWIVYLPTWVWWLFPLDLQALSVGVFVTHYRATVESANLHLAFEPRQPRLRARDVYSSGAFRPYLQHQKPSASWWHRWTSGKLSTSKYVTWFLEREGKAPFTIATAPIVIRSKLGAVQVDGGMLEVIARAAKDLHYSKSPTIRWAVKYQQPLQEERGKYRKKKFIPPA